MDSPSSRTLNVTRLPPDCASKCLSFLTLVDVLSFGAVSLSTLRDGTREVDRRKNLLSEPYVCCDPIRNPRKCRPSSEVSPARAAASSTLSPESSDDRATLPSVYERIVSLHRSLPVTHRLREQAGFLTEELKPGDEDSNATIRLPASNALDGAGPLESSDGRFSERLLELRRASRAHKIHASMTKSVMNGHHHESRYDSWSAAAARDRAGMRADGSTDSPITNRTTTVATESDPEIVVSLDDYVGDVLCAYYLMGHSAAGIVEGGPSEQHWMDVIFDEVAAEKVCTKSWYLAWVFMHSSLLRDAPFTEEQRSLLGLEPITSTTQSIAERGEAQGTEESPLILPAPPFMGVDKQSLMYCMQQLRVDLEREALLKIKLNDFGPLGPTFRGRDSVRGMIIRPNIINAALMKFDGLSPSHYRQASPSVATLCRQWRDGVDPCIFWMLEVHAQASKTRPMTVEAPTVSILKSM